MTFILDLLQGLGIAAAIGIRPLLPVLLVGALASANAGLDFDGTSFAFLEAWPFWVGLLVVVVALEFATRRGNSPDNRAVAAAGLLLVVALGALQAAGSLEDHGYSAIIGLIGGAAAAALGWAATRSLFVRVRRRLDPDAAAALPFYGEGVAAVGAGASVLFPPLALILLGGLAWLLVGGRRREGEKYAGLRILR